MHMMITHANDSSEVGVDIIKWYERYLGSGGYMRIIIYIIIRKFHLYGIFGFDRTFHHRRGRNIFLVGQTARLGN